MSKQYPGGFIVKNPISPTSSAASGIWTIDQAMQYNKAYTWPGVYLPDPYFKNVSLLLNGNGTNAAQNNTFIDSSSNNLTITRNGNATQGTFSPYSSEEGKWSNYFDGNIDYLTVPYNSALTFGSGDFTVEAWVYLQASASGSQVITGIWSDTADGPQSWVFYIDNSDLVRFLADTNLANDSQILVSPTALTKNVWSHLAVSRIGSQWKLFIDGVAVHTVTQTSTIDAGDGTQPLSIGGFGAASPTDKSSITGYISNLRIIKGTGIYSADFTVPTSPLTAVSGTSLLTCQSNRFKDNSSNNFAITVTGDTKILSYSPITSSTPYNSSVNGGSAYFDGSGDNLSIPANSVFAYGTGDFTIEAWIYQTQRNTLSDICSCHNYGVSADWLWSINSSGNLFFQISSSGTGAQTSSSAVPLNAWTHVAVSRENGTMRQYINGVQVSSATYTTSIGSTLTFSIGASYNLNAASTFYGYISNLRIIKGTALYTSAFTPPTAPLTSITNTSLLCNFTNGGIVDNSKQNIIETIGNAQISTSIKKYGTGSMYFDGNGDYLTMRLGEPFNFGTANFTIEMWIYPLTTNHQSACLFSQEHISASNTPISICIFLNGGAFESVGNGLGYGVYNGPVSSSWTFVNHNTATISANAWTHIALVRNGNVFTLFVNGTQVHTTTNATSCSLGTTQYLVGRRWDTYGSYPYFNGYMDDFRITKGIARYTANFTPPTLELPSL